MRLVADEHFPAAAVRVLVQAGYEVLEICRTHSSSSDPEVLEVCMAFGGTLLTMDKGFGELTVRHRMPATSGIILFRLGDEKPDEYCRIVLAAVSSESSWEGYFSVVTKDKIRRRPLYEQSGESFG